MTQPQRLADPPAQRCPKCASEHVARVSLTELAVYLRCSDCGEVWAFRDRRTIRRPNDPKRF